jgi:hypothetical protein
MSKALTEAAWAMANTQIAPNTLDNLPERAERAAHISIQTVLDIMMWQLRIRLLDDHYIRRGQAIFLDGEFIGFSLRNYTNRLSSTYLEKD